MIGFRSGFALPAIAAAAALTTACFTEVGNPDGETQMTAQFRVDYSANAFAPEGDSVVIQALSLQVLGATYQRADSTEGMVWNYPSGKTVDFTGIDRRAVLPARGLNTPAVLGMEMRLGFATRSPVTPNTLTFAAFRGSGYVKGTYIRDGNAVDFLFALPDTGTISLQYPQETLDAWRVGSAYHCLFSFYALGWLAGSDLDTVATVGDAGGHPFVLLDREHNADLHAALTDRFYQALNSAQVYPKRGPSP